MWRKIFNIIIFILIRIMTHEFGIEGIDEYQIYDIIIFYLRVIRHVCLVFKCYFNAFKY